MSNNNPDLPAVIGVGIDTSRYGHYVTFLQADLQPATAPLEFTETCDGYKQLQDKFEQLQRRFPNAVFNIRLDVAGHYAANLEAFLRRLPFAKTVSIGEPVRNKRYRDVHFPKRKSDVTESRSTARFAVVEKPEPAAEVPAPLRALREIASRLEAQTRQSTRHVNQLHNLLSRVFPELAVVAQDIAAQWVLSLLTKYPTPAKLAHARLASVQAISHIPAGKAERLHTAAGTSIASFTGSIAEALVLGLVRQIRLCHQEQTRLKKLLAKAYKALPTANHLDTIPGIGVVTAAVLTAKIVSIDRFSGPGQLVGYFGIFPEEYSSGIDATGQRRPGRRMHMCRRGNDLVRSYLYMAAMSAVQHNPAARALHRRLRQKGVAGNLALGHVMRKLLHLVFAVWKTGKPFDPQHYPWETATGQETAAGRKQGTCPA